MHTVALKEIRMKNNTVTLGDGITINTVIE